MDILLSWSGESSHEVSVFLREWLQEVLPTCKPWVSSEDITKGKRWSDELHGQLEKSKVAIICITPENVKSPWLYYEAGVVAAKVSDALVCPYLVGVPAKLVTGTPLGLYQWTEADKQDTLKLLRTLNQRLDNPYDAMMLEGNYNSKWPQLKRRLDKVIEGLAKVEDTISEIDLPVSQQLTSEGKELLIAACQADGHIMSVAYLGGHSIQVGQRQLIQDPSARTLARWKGALEELMRFGLIADQGYQREIFEVTREGWTVFDQLAGPESTPVD